MKSLTRFLYISSSLPSTMLHSIFVSYFQSGFQQVFIWPELKTELVPWKAGDNEEVKL